MNAITQESTLLVHPPLSFLSSPLGFPETKPDDTKPDISEVWTTTKFNRNNLNLDLRATKTRWSEEPNMEFSEKEKSPEPSPVEATPDKEDGSPAHHARRPMNAFLIFCKKHRPIVRDKYPNLENRGVTKILGEWWAQLDVTDKEPYTTLAKEYKDAFLSANPDFKWYKLPAPPLRTLNTRPMNPQKPPPSPSVTSPKAEFTPGKLADESQLGSITSLMTMNSSFNNNNNKIDTDSYFIKNNNNNNNNDDVKYDAAMRTPENTEVKMDSVPPKPIKKRFFEKFVDNNDVSRNIFDYNISAPSNYSDNEPNMTQQELLNKVVDSMFVQDDKETRKSGRSCKGKRYEKFMLEGKLLGSKRDKPQKSNLLDVNMKFEAELNTKTDKPKLDLDNTIKRLAERTICKPPEDNQKPEDVEKEERTRSISETSEDSYTKNLQNDFNLDSKIDNLPSLSYDMYLQKKKESKKRKIRVKTDDKHDRGTIKNGTDSPIGSKKRKNKQSITHLGKKPEMDSFTSDLSGLATLAEVAANTEKINEK